MSAIKKRRAVISGLLGASASCVGKIALDPDSPVQSRARNLCSHFASPDFILAGWSISSANVCTATELVIRGLCLLAMICLNAAMMASFLDGMQESGTVAGTALANAANFTLSAIYGILLFDESMNATWMLGFVMILSGVWLLSTVRLKGAKETTKKTR